MIFFLTPCLTNGFLLKEEKPMCYHNNSIFSFTLYKNLYHYIEIILILLNKLFLIFF